MLGRLTHVCELKLLGPTKARQIQFSPLPTLTERAGTKARIRTRHARQSKQFPNWAVRSSGVAVRWRAADTVIECTSRVHSALHLPAPRYAAVGRRTAGFSRRYSQTQKRE